MPSRVLCCADAEPQPDTHTWPPFPFANHTSTYKLYKLPEQDGSPRCRNSGICDGDYSCGADGLGCIRDAKERQERIRAATRWAWAGYR
jgi:mannosyl-oligosaccharide alpha-1,2-mannosidase